MEPLKLTPVASTIIEMFGPTSPEVLHDLEFDGEVLMLRARNIAFNQARAVADFSHGLEVSPYFVNYSPGYWGTYLN